MKTILSVVRDFVKGAGEKNLSVYAAGSAFFIILSVVPIIIVVSCMIPITGLSKEFLYEMVTNFLPAATEEFLVSLINYVYSNSTGMLPVAIILAIWSAGRGMLSLMRGLNEIHGITEKRGYFRLRVVSSFYTVILLLALVFTLVVSVFGQRFLLAILVLSIIFTFLYMYVPDIKTSFRKQFYGGVMAALGCSVFSYCFSVYVDNYNDFSSYGSISTIVIVMLWLYFTMYILLYGAYIGSYFASQDT
ncbi:MAG: YihY/virulence factor BrkB family protein [Lachnospiraceae bacterium]|nr:YihY/virulence factor BrkB family protein [Lachnospiraceae bacterium]MBR4061019.1 YihY/virulence factor BrkB family protein [Lachnospiraceae bacterium]